MRIKLYPSDTTASFLYRIHHPADEAANAGLDVTVAPAVRGAVTENGRLPDERKLPIERHPENPRYIRAIDEGYDVVVLQRPFEEAALVAIRQLQAAGTAIVVEIDDDIAHAHPAHPAARALSPTVNPDTNWWHFREACRLADLVTVTSPALARRCAAHGRVAILPNCVPASLLSLPRSSDGRTVGWRGWTITHPGDLGVTRGGVQQALDDTGARFLQIGQPAGVQEQLSLTDEPKSTGPLWNIHDFYLALGRLDVGIVPLTDIQFNHAKSYLAGIEYAARGVPFVASPVAEYRTLAGQGVGVLAGYRSREWRREIRKLLTDTSLRTELAEHGRQVVAEHHTYETQGWRWPEAWEQAIANARARRPTRAAA